MSDDRGDSAHSAYLRAHPGTDLAILDLGDDALGHVHFVERTVLVPAAFVEGITRGTTISWEQMMAAAWEATSVVARDGPGPALSAQTLAAVGGNPLRAAADPQRHVRMVLVALDGLRGRGLPRHEGRGYLELGQALLGFGMVADALDACERGRALLEQCGDGRGLRAAYARLAGLMSRMGLAEQALLYAEAGLQVGRHLTREKAAVRSGEAHFTNYLHHQRVSALTRIGSVSEAEQALQEWSADDSRSGAQYDFDVLTTRADLRLRQERTAEALDDYLQAIDMRFTDADLGSLSRRSYYLENSVTLFGRAVGAAINAGRLDLAVAILAVLGTRGVIRTGNPVPPQSFAALQQIDGEISELARRATGAAVAGDRGLLTVHDDRARQLLDTRDTLLEGGGADGSSRGRTVTQVARTIVAGVSPAEVALCYSRSSDGSMVVFVLHDGGVQLYALDASGEEVEQLATAARDECLRREGSDSLGRLGEVALGPVAGLLTDASRVLVTAPGALGDFPFHAAPFRGRPLVSWCEVRGLPSLAPLAPRERRPAGRDESREPPRVAVAAVRQPRYEVLPELPALPREVAALRNAFPAATVRMDEEATAAAVSADIAAADVLHVAGHATFEPEHPLLARILMADRPLFAFEIMCAARAPRLVNLSGCRAGAERRQLSGEGEGLAAAFLAAGARTVVAPLWPVRDDVALAFNELLYRELSRPGTGPGEAARRAQLSLMTEPRFAHHGLWGAFTALGAL